MRRGLTLRTNRFVTTAPAIPTFLPTVASAPTAVWGTSKLISAYAGATGRIQKISDDVESDVSFGTKYVDLPNVGLGTHQWKTLYDQTGNGNHLTQATKVNQPAASSLTANGCPIVHFDSSSLAVGVRAKNMQCTTGPVTEKSAFTMFFLIAPSFSFADNYYMRQPHTATTLSLFTQTTNVGIRGNNTSPFNSTRRMPKVQPQVLRWRGGTTGKQWGINGVTQLLSTAPAAGTETGISIGNHSATASYDGEFDLMGIVVYNSTLSDADCLLVETALYAQCIVQTTANNLVVFDGDSRTEGSGNTLNQSWVRRLTSDVSKPMHSINMGIGGQTLATMTTNVAARVNALYDATYTKNIVVVGGAAINDFTAGTSGATCITNIQTYCTALHANQSLVIATCPLRDTSTGAMNTERGIYNDWLRANYASLKAGAVLVDLDVLFPTWSGTNYIDIVHFNDAGQLIWYTAFKSAIETLLV